MRDALTFWHSDGSIIWAADGRPTPLHAQNVPGLLDIFSDEMMAAARANDQAASRAFAKLFNELSDARAQREKWLRATSGRVAGHVIRFPMGDAA